MWAPTKNEQLHRVVTRDSRLPKCFELADLSEDALLRDVVVAIGGQHASGDFSPYYVLYKDFADRVHILRYTISEGLKHVKEVAPGQDALREAVIRSEACLEASNSALRIFSLPTMVLRYLVCKV